MIRVQWFANGLGTSHAWAKPLRPGSRSMCGAPWTLDEPEWRRTNLKLFRCWRCKDRIARMRKRRKAGRG